MNNHKKLTFLLSSCQHFACNNFAIMKDLPDRWFSPGVGLQSCFDVCIYMYIYIYIYMCVYKKKYACCVHCVVLRCNFVYLAMKKSSSELEFGITFHLTMDTYKAIGQSFMWCISYLSSVCFHYDLATYASVYYQATHFSFEDRDDMLVKSNSDQGK